MSIPARGAPDLDSPAADWRWSVSRSCSADERGPFGRYGRMRLAIRAKVRARSHLTRFNSGQNLVMLPCVGRRSRDGRMGPSARTIIELNIRHYRALLTSEADPAKRRTIAALLAEEEAKLARLTSAEPPRRTRMTSF